MQCCHCAAGGPSEYQIKAAFIYNFTKFVEWPNDAFSSASDPMVIGILGDDPFGNALDQAVKGKSVDGHRLVIKRFPKPKDIDKCHILFVCASESRRIDKAIDAVRGSCALTVGESDEFAQRGGIIGFTLADNRIALEINVDAEKRERLKISSKLLKLARIVRD
jgi:hypothetical protein